MSKPDAKADESKTAPAKDADAPNGPSFSVAGRVEGRHLPRLVKIAFGITGISLLIYLGALFGRFVLGFKRSGVLEVSDGRAQMKVSTRFAGREINSAVERFTRAQVLSVRLEVRYPYLLTLLGLVCLGFGVIAGILLILDGLQGEFTGWILSGVGILLAGVVLDLVFTTIATSLPGQTSLVLWLPGNRALRLVGCKAEDAEKLVEWANGPARS